MKKEEKKYINKKEFFKILDRIDLEEIKINIVIWHGDSVQYRDAIYLDIYIDGEDGLVELDFAEIYPVYNDNEENMKILKDIQKKLARKIKGWLKDTVYYKEVVKVELLELNI